MRLRGLLQDQIDAVAANAKMTPKEKDIFKRLASNPNTVVPRAALRAEFPGRAPRTLDTYIKNIRRKLAESGYTGGAIRTEAGVGFSFAARD